MSTGGKLKKTVTTVVEEWQSKNQRQEKEVVDANIKSSG
jgi:hypothetical protein